MSDGLSGDGVIKENIFTTVHKVRYKNRTPDPGECTVTGIDWEKRTCSISNGCHRYYPSFDEIYILE